MKNKKLMIPIIVLAVLLIGFLAYNQVGQVIYSSSISSISNAYVIDGGNKIVVQAQISPNANQNLRVDFNLDDINAFLEEDGYKATDISTLYMQMSDPSRDFFVTSQREVVYKYADYKISTFNSCQNNLPNSESIYITNLIDLFSKYCVYKYPIGSIALSLIHI